MLTWEVGFLKMIPLKHILTDIHARIGAHSIQGYFLMAETTEGYRSGLEVPTGQGYFYQGGQGALPPLNFDNPKRSKIWYVACSTIILNAKCESSAIDFLDIF